MTPPFRTLPRLLSLAMVSLSISSAISIMQPSINASSACAQQMPGKLLNATGTCIEHSAGPQLSTPIPGYEAEGVACFTLGAAGTFTPALEPLDEGAIGLQGAQINGPNPVLNCGSFFQEAQVPPDDTPAAFNTITATAVNFGDAALAGGCAGEIQGQLYFSTAGDGTFYAAIDGIYAGVAVPVINKSVHAFAFDVFFEEAGEINTVGPGVGLGAGHISLNTTADNDSPIPLTGGNEATIFSAPCLTSDVGGLNLEMAWASNTIHCNTEPQDSCTIPP